ncbi:MAG: hypothetical protein U9O56_07975 [Campylobacterota bacterium]|nr:hypothetical protein [Campylobacterota bacterium]
MNTLFRGDFTDDDVYNYIKTISDKIKEDSVVVDQIKNNTKEQAMLGGFGNKMNDAVIDTLDIHQNMATQVLSEDKIRKELVSIVYDIISKSLKSDIQIQNRNYSNLAQYGSLKAADKKVNYGENTTRKNL